MKKRTWTDLCKAGSVASWITAGTGLFLFMGWPFFRFITYAGRKKDEKENSNKKKWLSLKQTEVNHPRHKFAEEYDAVKNWCKAQPMEDWYIKSRDGLKLHAYFYRASNERRFVILSHGYRGTSFGSIAHIAESLHNEGCSLLFIDQRCCGKSEGKYITFGAKEQYDLTDWIKRLEKVNKDRKPVYLYGQSMGASTVLLSSGQGLPREVRGLIADSGFHSMKYQLSDMASRLFHFHWIPLMLFRVDLFCRIFAGFAMKDTDTSGALRRNECPVLFFHGTADTYVGPENSRINYRLCRAEKELVMIEGARHLCCSYEAPELYMEKIKEFFRKNDH